MLQVEWSSGEQTLMEVELVVFAYDRRGLVRDITDVVAQEHLSIVGMNTLTDEDRIARVAFRLGVGNLEQLGKLIKRLQGVPNVSEVRARLMVHCGIIQGEDASGGHRPRHAAALRARIGGASRSPSRPARRRPGCCDMHRSRSSWPVTPRGRLGTGAAG